MLRKGMGETYCKFILERIGDVFLRTKTLFTTPPHVLKRCHFGSCFVVAYSLTCNQHIYLDLLRGESSRGQKGPFFPTLCLFSVI